MKSRSSADRTRYARPGRLGAEAIRNCAARLALTLTVMVTWSASALAVYLPERDAAQANEAYTQLMVRDGYTTLLIGQSDIALENLTWSNCSTLRGYDGVRAVVGIREPVMLRLWNTSGPEMAVREAMGDVASFLAMTNPSSPHSLGTSLVFDFDALGARQPSAGQTEFATRVVQQSGDAHNRTAVTGALTSFGGGFSGTAIMGVPPGGEVSTCVVLTDLDRRVRVAAVASGLFPVADGFGQRWALINAERFDAPRDRYERRPSRWYWIGAVALTAMSWAFRLWILRSDHAVLAVAGLRTGGLLGILSAELLVIAVGTSVITLAVATIDLRFHAEAMNSVARGMQELARAGLASLGACISLAAAVASATSRRTIDSLKDR